MAMSPDHTEVIASSSIPLVAELENTPHGPTSNVDQLQNDSKKNEDVVQQDTSQGSCSYLEMEEGPEVIYGPINNPERTNSPVVMYGPHNQAGAEMGDTLYGPMNNTGGEDLTTERISKDIKDTTARPGQCGLYNLGNTCFMNAGLQSLMATPPVIRYFLQDHSDSVVSHNLVEQFSMFVSKFWSGQFSILYPKDLKTALGHIHGQFKDYRQHDCQEFLALLLDTLNDQTKAGPNTPFFITHNDLNNTHSQMSSANVDDKCTTEQSQEHHVSMETSGNHIAQEEEEICPMPLTQLKVSTDNEFLEDLHLNNTAVLKNKLPSIENFYAKETKTLNTNVLVSESPEDLLNFDSSKYAKPENCPVVHNDIGVSHVVNEPMVVMDLKRCRVSPKGVKDINIYADMCNRNLNRYCDAYEENEKVKRSKFDTFEKNFQHQAFSKLNCLPAKCPSEEKCTQAKIKDKCDVEMEEILGDEYAATGNQEVNKNKINVQLQFEDDEKSKQELSSGAAYDAEVDQDGDSGDAVEQDEDDDADTEQDTAEKFNMDEGEWDDTKLSRLADKRWMDHLLDNQSVILNTFHGQYKSSVKCSECNNVSVTFEPFMYLSVPIPRANERNLCVTYLPIDNIPTQYLLVLDKRDRISKVKNHLRQLTQTENDIVMAEVLDHHVARIIDDTTMLRYINSTSRKLYAFEMSPTTESGCQSELMSSAGNQEMDVFSHVGTFSSADVYNNFNNGSFDMLAASQGTGSMTDPVIVPDGIAESGWDNGSSLQYSWSQETKTENKETPIISGTSDLNIGQWSLQDGNTPSEIEEAVSDVQWSSVTTLEEDDQQLANDQTKASTDQSKDRVVTVDQWRSCSICLEELADPELLVHKTCGATFCHTCLEMSVLHYGQDNFLCPVCSCPAVMTEDFTQLADSDKNIEERKLLVDVTFCHTAQEQRNLIGHPHILYLSSQMSGAQLYDRIDKIVPDVSQFTLLMTDAQGSRCSRCVYTAKCTGCVISRDGTVSLRPGDTLCVCLDGLEQSVIERMQLYVDHSSMKGLRPVQPLSIYDCIKAFTESEVLDKHNPWYCPRCQQNQCASKSMTVWRYPDVLIVHLKRFVYHDLVSVKVDSEIEFPLEGLNLSHHISGPVSCDLTYDLYSIVCHFGELNSGHYTCFTKHPVDKAWYYYNDENVTQQTPRQEDFKNAYILMYHRRGADFSMSCLPSLKKREEVQEL